MDSKLSANVAPAGKSVPDILANVQRMDGTLLKILIPMGSTISQLKVAIFANCGVSSSSQKLVHKTGVVQNNDLIDKFNVDDENAVEFTMVLHPFGQLLDSLEALDLTIKIDAVATSTVNEILATLARQTGVSELPEHFASWFKFLLENGVILTFWDPRECLNHAERHSPGLLNLSWTETHVNPFTADDYCMLDVTTGDGVVLWYSDFDATYQSCVEWQNRGKLERTWGSLSEYLMFKKGEASERRKVAAEHEKLSRFGRCVVIRCLLPSASSGEFESKVFTPEFTPEFEAYTVSTLKNRLSEMTGIAPQKLRVIFAGKEAQDSTHLTDYGIRGGCSFHVVGKR